MNVIRTMPEWEAFKTSDHRREGHPVPVQGCFWCERIAEVAVRFVRRAVLVERERAGAGARAVTLTITIPGRPPTPNNRFGNKYAASAVTKRWRQTAKMLGVDAKNRSGWIAPAVARITVTFIVPTHGHRDVDNLVASTKPLTDGLRDARVLVDDHSAVLEWEKPVVRYVRGVTATEYVIEVVVPAHPTLGLM